MRKFKIPRKKKKKLRSTMGTFTLEEAIAFTTHLYVLACKCRNEAYTPNFAKGGVINNISGEIIIPKQRNPFDEIDEKRIIREE